MSDTCSWTAADLLRVPVARTPVRIAFENGEAIAAEMFLLPRTRNGESQTVEDLLNGETRFFPAGIPGEGAIVAQKAAVRWVAQHPLEPVARFVAEPAASERARVEIVLRGGEKLHGRLHYELPPHAGRLSDFLNSAGSFFPLEGEDGWLLVHKSFVIHVRELPAGD